jgi:hypothetical protein
MILVMRPPRRRETFIALRATRTACRMARDVFNPHMDVPEFQREIVPREELTRRHSPVPYLLRSRPHTARPFTLRDWIHITVILALLFGCFVLMSLWQAPR